ncbi:MAG: MBL fold metallo-hydrolase [Saprospiraceae bacterium]|nr:MBL fold metallo-hydrolase [Saprospiraceae bacterium]
MIHVVSFVCNDFQENTYVVFDETKECIIIDPGCNAPHERNAIDEYISQRKLTPVKLINTHCHIDHVLGNGHIAQKYGIGLEIHENEIPILDALTQVGLMYNIPTNPSPAPSHFLKEGDIIRFGVSELECIFTPGHSPGSLSFYNKNQQILISGDVLFRRSIGRTDLPGGNHQALLDTIQQKLFLLPADTVVYSGHGPTTTIGEEKQYNPFFN